MLGFVRIAIFDRGDDPKYLFGRFGTPIAQKRCRQAHEMDLVVNSARGFDQLSVAGCLIDQLVKLPVQLRKLARIVLGKFTQLRRLDQIVQASDRFRRRTLARKPRGKTLKPLAQFEQFENLALREIRNKGATPRPDRGEPLVVEAVQRFAEWRAADTQGLTEASLVDPRPGLQSPLEDHPADAIIKRRMKRFGRLDLFNVEHERICWRQAVPPCSSFCIPVYKIHVYKASSFALMSETCELPSKISWRTEISSLPFRFPGRTVVTDASRSATVDEIVRHADAVTARLFDHGIRPGERVVTLIANSVEAISASFGIMLAGACEVTLNPGQSLEEQTWCADLVNVKAFLHDGRAKALPQVSAAAIDCTKLDVPGKPGWHSPTGSDWGRILFTSGTTGRPKGVVHTHAGRWLSNLLLRHSIRDRLRGGSTLLMTPFSHGASLLSYALLFDGAPVHLMQGVDRAVIEPLVRSGSIENIFAPPTVLVKLVEIFSGERIETVRTIFTGTAPLSAELYGAVRDIFGPVVRVTYGMSEIFNPITVLQPDLADRCYAECGQDAVGVVGWPAPGVDVSIRDDDGRDVHDGEPGQVFLRARHMYAGYLRDGGQFQPAQPFHPTGDIGTFSQAFGLRLLGRMHDMIKTGGYKVMAQEVEVALRERGVTGEFVVLGLPSQYWGEIIGCVRAANDDGWINDIRKAAEPLTRYKQPRVFVSVPTIWKNAIGKTDRNQIRSFIDTHYELEDGPYPALRRRT